MSATDVARVRSWLAPTPGTLLVLSLCALLAVSCSKSPRQENEFAQIMNTGKNYLDQAQAGKTLDQAQAEKALPLFTQALALRPSDPDVHVNLANTYLLGGKPAEAIVHAQEALSYDRNSAAAAYVAGCASLRARKFDQALRFLQAAHDLEPNVAAVNFQLGCAHQELSHLEEAVTAFTDTTKLEPEHPVAHYRLFQLLNSAGRQPEAMKALETHRQIQAKAPAGFANPAQFERCKLTLGRAPRQVELPDPKGLAVTFTDATADAFGNESQRYHGPLGVLDYNHDDRNSLFVFEGTNGFRLLANTQGKFAPLGDVYPANPGGQYRRCLVGDLNNDRFEDVLVVGEESSYIYRFATNGLAREWSAAAGLRTFKAADGALLDLDFTGKLDLVGVVPGSNAVRVLRNLGKETIYFKDITATSGVPAMVTGARQVVVDDWNNDDLLDVFVSRAGQPPLFLMKTRGGPLVPTNLPPGQLEGAVLAIGDVNNDARPDLLVGEAGHLDFLFGGRSQFQRLPLSLPELNSLTLLDYDNDGWLDLLLAGQGLQLWRNLGDGKFTNVTARVGLDQGLSGRITAVVAADFDQDGDTDLVLAVEGQGLKLLRNDGGNAHRQMKIRLLGNRSNASGLGIRIQVAAAALRVYRTVNALPIEIGLGQHAQADSLIARWFDLPYIQVDAKADPRNAIQVFEPTMPVGSCPYLYAWDGQRYRFVTDILGCAPVGLRVSDTVFAEADPHEYVWIGSEPMFPPREGAYELQITEELREVLYLDEAKLAVVDHPAGTEVHTTCKFRPGKPFPPAGLWTLDHRHPLVRATRLTGADVTDRLLENDGLLVSPDKLRVPQLRGLAEPHGVVLDFGTLPVQRPLVLVLSGWLRFGGGMANVGASHNPDLPFPFPKLEVETEGGRWQPVDVVVGAPAGKTKTILVDLEGKLPSDSRRLRLTTAFEIHWDRIALMERRSNDGTRVTVLAPDSADLHWRGFSEFADLPWTVPLTPVYERAFGTAPWTITPMGWCTRYGRVDELLARPDQALALLNGGDELTLRFRADALPPKPTGATRDFFLYSVGWDKDSDFHVELGYLVEPLPWPGMDDQLYGRQPRPVFPQDSLMKQYTTRWVGQHTLQKTARR